MPAKTRPPRDAASNPTKTSQNSMHPTQADPELAPPTALNSRYTDGQKYLDSTSRMGTEGNPLFGKDSDGPAHPAVNRKKQKRREKEAAKRAAEQRTGNESMTRGGYVPNVQSLARSYFREDTDDFDNYGYGDGTGEADEAFFSGAEDPVTQSNLLGSSFDQIDHITGDTVGRKKRKGKAGGQLSGFSHSHRGNSSSTIRNPDPLSEPHPPPTSSFSTAALRSAHENFTHDQIWNTSTQAERENIKQFWLELGEEERRSLVKVEKEAVLRKMKEQQKHSCSCTVCGRKRTAIEEELEVLYDAYYEELEQFANHNSHLPNGAAVMSDPRSYAHLRTRRHPMAGQFPVERGRHDLIEDDEDLDDDDFDGDEGPYSEDDVEEIPRGPPDFFAFGNSLTVKDGILTVADDLLKNDGKHFIDMMESLAEKRMQRHNHPPLDEEDDYDDEDEDEDYDSQDDDELEADEMSAMTEEQRMEEGRRMFQIFAARMFEQRVLTAYRERVARERQRKLIEELEEENRLDTQKEAKKAREAARKKEKKKIQKQVKDEGKAKKEAEKAAQEAAIRAEEDKKLEEQRHRKEEQRKKREAEKKAADEERRRKEAEKQRKAQEERERQQESERKQREAKETERRKREEARKKEREEKAAREREIRERKAKEVADRKAAEEQVRREKEAAAKVDKEAKERSRLDEQARQNAKRTVIAIPPAMQPNHPSLLQSPQCQVATPIMPVKAPLSARPHQHSHQGPPSHGSSPRSQQATTTETTLSSTPSSTSIVQPNAPAAMNMPGKQHNQITPLHHPQPSAPLSPLSNQTRSGQPPYGYNGMPGPAANGVTSAGLGMMPSMMPQMPMYHGPPLGGPHRGYCPPNGIPFPPGINGNRHLAPLGQPHFLPQSGGMPGAPVAPPTQAAKMPTHTRQHSASQDRVAESVGQPTPISRPAPAALSSHSTPDKKEKRETSDPEVEQLATQLGSKALLDDSDIPLSASSADPLPAPGAPGSGRTPFGHFSEPKHDAFQPGNWGAFSPTGAFTAPANWAAPGLGPKHGGGWATPHQSAANAFGIIGAGAHAPHRPHASRPVAIRLMVADACKKLSVRPGTASDRFHPAEFLLSQIERMKPPNEPVISLNEMLAICDTEGNPQNGGGSFFIRDDGLKGQAIKFEPFAGSNSQQAVGDIGSPIAVHAQPAPFGGIGQAVGGMHRGQ